MNQIRCFNASLDVCLLGGVVRLSDRPAVDYACTQLIFFLECAA
jgi:hypothetical protein